MILDCKDKEEHLYNYFYTKYRYLKEKKEYHLSDADFDLLISGATLSRIRDKTALLSFDTGMGKAWKELSRELGIKHTIFGFFVRNGFNEYSMFF